VFWNFQQSDKNWDNEKKKRARVRRFCRNSTINKKFQWNVVKPRKRKNASLEHRSIDHYHFFSTNRYVYVVLGYTISSNHTFYFDCANSRLVCLLKIGKLTLFCSYTSDIQQFLNGNFNGYQRYQPTYFGPRRTCFNETLSVKLVHFVPIVQTILPIMPKSNRSMWRMCI